MSAATDRVIWLALCALVACKSALPTMNGDGGATDAPPDVARDASADAATDAALVDAAPDAAGTYADPFGPLVAMPGTCSTDHWCWLSPHPAGNTYDHVFATAPDNIWLIGGHGIALQWDGAAWHDRTPPKPPGLLTYQLAFSISGLGPNDMWIAVDNTLQHWDGTAWTIVDQGYRFGNVWAAPNGEVWSTILMSSNLWHKAPGGLPQIIGAAGGGNVWGLSAENFWVVSGTSIIHYESGQFGLAYTASHIVGMIGGGAVDDMWFGGAGGLVHYANGTFTEVPTSLASNAFINFAGANGPNDVTFWGTGGFILHWDGQTLATTQVTPNAVGGEGRIIDGRWWIAGGSGAIATIHGTTEEQLVDGRAWLLRPLWGSSKDDMYWASTEYPTVDYARHWDGAQWTDLPLQITALDGTPGNLFGGYRDTLLHFDGTAWTTTQPEPGSTRVMYRVWATGTGEAIAVGSGGFAYRYKSGGWTPIASGTSDDLLGIWGRDADHASITTSSNRVLAWDRANPGVFAPDPQFPTNTDDQLGPIHGAGGTVWIGIENHGAIWRGTAAGWSREGDGAILAHALFATSATDVLVADDGTAALARFDGTTWTPEDINSWHPVGQWIYRPPGGPTYLVGVTAGLGGALVHP